MLNLKKAEIVSLISQEFKQSIIKRMEAGEVFYASNDRNCYIFSEKMYLENKIESYKKVVKMDFEAFNTLYKEHESFNIHRIITYLIDSPVKLKNFSSSENEDLYFLMAKYMVNDFFKNKENFHYVKKLLFVNAYQNLSERLSLVSHEMIDYLYEKGRIYSLISGSGNSFLNVFSQIINLLTDDKKNVIWEGLIDEFKNKDDILFTLHKEIGDNKLINDYENTFSYKKINDLIDKKIVKFRQAASQEITLDDIVKNEVSHEENFTIEFSKILTPFTKKEIIEAFKYTLNIGGDIFVLGKSFKQQVKFKIIGDNLICDIKITSKDNLDIIEKYNIEYVLKKSVLLLINNSLKDFSILKFNVLNNNTEDNASDLLNKNVVHEIFENKAIRVVDEAISEIRENQLKDKFKERDSLNEEKKIIARKKI